MGLNLEGLKERKKKGSSGDRNRWKPANGMNNIRLLPPTSDFFETDIDYFAVEQWVHWISIEGDKTIPFRCSRDKDEPCLACKYFFRLYKSEEPGDKELSEEISRQVSRLVNIIDLDNPEEGIQVFDTKTNNYNDFYKYITNPKYGEILSPTEGRSWEVEKTPGGETASGWPEYNIIPDPSTSDISDILPDDYKEQLDQLESHTMDYISSAEVARILDKLGVPLDDEDIPAPSNNKPRTSKPKAKAKAKVVEEDGDEDVQLPWEDKDDEVEEEEDDDTEEVEGACEHGEADPEECPECIVEKLDMS